MLYQRRVLSDKHIWKGKGPINDLNILKKRCRARKAEAGKGHSSGVELMFYLQRLPGSILVIFKSRAKNTILSTQFGERWPITTYHGGLDGTRMTLYKGSFIHRNNQWKPPAVHKQPHLHPHTCTSLITERSQTTTSYNMAFQNFFLNQGQSSFLLLK